MKGKQTNHSDTIKLEYETKLNDKDDLIKQIKIEQQQEIDQLKSQINGLQDKGKDARFVVL